MFNWTVNILQNYWLSNGDEKAGKTEFKPLPAIYGSTLLLIGKLEQIFNEFP